MMLDYRPEAQVQTYLWLASGGLPSPARTVLAKNTAAAGAVFYLQYYYFARVDN